MKRYTITISRQFGSMGRPIARRLAELLDVNFYDREAVENQARQEHLPVSIINDLQRAAEDPYFMMDPATCSFTCTRCRARLSASWPTRDPACL